MLEESLTQFAIRCPTYNVVDIVSQNHFLTFFVLKYVDALIDLKILKTSTPVLETQNSFSELLYKRYAAGFQAKDLFDQPHNLVDILTGIGRKLTVHCSPL
jgi:hypothetical protein